MEIANLTRNIQSAVPDKEILKKSTIKTGDEYWYIATIDNDRYILVMRVYEITIMKPFAIQ